MTPLDRQFAMGALVRSSGSLTTNIVLLLGLCAMGEPPQLDPTVSVRFPQAVAPTSAAVQEGTGLDSILAHELVSFIHWLSTSQIQLDKVSKAALYEGRWDRYL